MTDQTRRNQTPSDAAPEEPTATAPTQGMDAHRHERGAALPPGAMLAARYRIEELLGRGGMGTVYRAFDQQLEQLVAIKILHESGKGSESSLSRLRSEVRLAQQVSHPNVCRVHDIGETEDVRFLSMEYIDGQDLASLLSQGRLQADTALSIARQICTGLAAAHDKGVLHRDLKPANVMVSTRGAAMVTDFGLAHSLRDEARPGAYEGTPQYMSPEQLAGDEFAVESDIYALGLVLYELMTGHRVFEGRSQEELLRQHAEPIEPPSTLAPDIDPDIERLILRCLEEDLSDRPPSARNVAEALPSDEAFAEAMAAAQKRADQIAAFRSELLELQQAGVVELEPEQGRSIEHYHRGVLREFVERFDIDLTERGKQLSLGMRLVSFLGALAFSASALYFFYRIWGSMSVPWQVGLLMGGPVIGLISTELISRRDQSGYFSKLTALVALACMVINVTALRSIFSQIRSEFDFLAWGLFGLALAYGYGHRLLLWFGLLGVASFLNAWIVGVTGVYWLYCFARPESYLAVGALIFVSSLLLPHREHPEFPAIYRVFGLIHFLLPLWVLANWGAVSYLPMNASSIEIVYQIAGFIASAAAIWVGVRRHWKETINMGSTFFVIFLYSKYVDWWWDWMPKYVFFFLVGLTALLVLLLLKRLRTSQMAWWKGSGP